MIPGPCRQEGQSTRPVLGAITMTVALTCMDSLSQLGYRSSNAMAYPRLPRRLVSDLTVLITMADPSVADSAQTEQVNVAHDGCSQSDYVRATHWPAVHTVNGFHFPIWGR